MKTTDMPADAGNTAFNQDMPRRAATVRTLADEYYPDLDEVLVTLWDAGLDHILDVDTRIAARDVPRVRDALGLVSVRELRTVAYWREKLGLGPSEITAYMATLGIAISGETRVLPKGALARLRRLESQSSTDKALRASLPPVTLEDAAPPLPPAPEFQWSLPGSARPSLHLGVNEVVQIHEQLEVEFAAAADPILPAGIRDMALLESAVSRPLTSLGGQPKYVTVEGAAAALLHSLTHNHPFYNGNKRTALVASLVALDRNHILLTCSQDDLFRFMLKIAQHRLVPRHWSDRSDREVMEIAAWIYRNSRPIQRGERPIKWRELRKILSRFDCRLEGPLPGNRMKVRRTVTRKRFLGVRSERELVAHAWYAGDGREIRHDHLRYVREALELTDEHGYDSAYFYGSDAREPDEFIGEYRTILRRLAKL